MNKILSTVVPILLLLLFIGAVVGLVYLDFSAFRQKFPDAAWWAWFFSHR